jgi:hypothetical protein
MDTKIMECNEIFDKFQKSVIALHQEIAKIKPLQEKLTDLKEGTLAYLELMKEITIANTKIQELQLEYQVNGLNVDRFKTIVLIEFNAKSFSPL